jgi:CheY-like chemotaxis protein
MPTTPTNGGTAPQKSVLALAENVSTLDLLEAALALVPGVQVIGALQGRLGLELAKAHQPRLIVLGAALPDIPGLQVVRQLQTDPATRAIPLISHGGPESAGHAPGLLAAGVRAHVVLPAEVARLVALGGQLLG